jgi:hypothetical protein
MACQTPQPNVETHILYFHENNNVSVSALPCVTTDETDSRGHVTVVSKVGRSPDIVFN